MNQKLERWGLSDGLHDIIRAVMVILMAMVLLTGLGLRASAEDADGLSKKGIQGLEYYEDTDADHMLDNLYLDQYYSDTYVEGWKKYTSGQYTYYIDEAGLASRAAYFKRCHLSGTKVYCTLLLLADNCDHCTGLADEHTPVTASPLFRGFNTRETDGRKVVLKVFKIVGKYFGDSVDYWIIGNEVNQIEQYDIGISSTKSYASHYGLTMYYCWYAMKSYNSDVSVLVSLDHCWNTTGGNRMNARYLLKYVEEYLSTKGDFNWGVAYHPYSMDLLYTPFWEENSTVTDTETTTFITMKNIHVLTDYMNQSTMLYNGQVRPIVMTELGYDAVSRDIPNGEAVQAAAFALSYYIAEANPDIDAIIYLNYKDNQALIDMGLYMGLVQTNGTPRYAYNVFKYMDTTQGHWFTDAYLPILGVSSWSEIVPGYENISITKTASKPASITSNITSATKSGSTITVNASCMKNYGKKMYYFYLYSGDGYQTSYLLQKSTSPVYTGEIRTNGKARIACWVYSGSSKVKTSYIYIKNTGTADTYTGMKQVGNTQILVNKGYWMCNWNSDRESYTVLKYIDGMTYYLTNGKIDTSVTGLICNYTGSYYYIKKGVRVNDATGFYTFNGQKYFLKSGKWASAISGAILFQNRYYVVRNGLLDTTATGLQAVGTDMIYVKAGVQTQDRGLKFTNNQGTFLLENGKLVTYSGLYFLTTTDANSETSTTIYYLEDGFVNYDFEGTIESDGVTYEVLYGTATVVVPDSEEDADSEADMETDAEPAADSAS